MSDTPCPSHSRTQPAAARYQEADLAAVRRVLGGDREAFRELVERYQQKVFQTVLRLVENPAEAEELAQETFLKAYSSLGRYDAQWAFSTWLLTIAHRTALSALRARGVRPRLEFMETLPEPSPSAPTSPVTPATQALREEWIGRLKAEIQALGTKMRTAFSLRYEEDCSISEIASITGSSELAVKVLLHRARRILRERLDRFFDTAP
ncbi:MAG TPA: RNA polymerase sigma factor [Candidatus Sumerlaeota bacterium]|nr:RNA polymerase sigma factor [Candidatus Sumerlaeota bacterium]HPS01037.1 RNA polymerase sigma factor [Candidatus Sumerlaeota bacterium]